MMRPVYYNDHDKFCCAWLRELIADGHLPAGDVDDRSIKDVQPDDLRGYLQIHLFAGIGGWPYALRLAGFPDDRECWTASCPCPPFSSAGKSKACPECDGTNPVPCPRRTGFFICCLCGHAWLADDRHLWPEVWRLVRDRRPQLVVGEQVASPDGRTWLASVRASLEILSYAPWGADLPAAGVGAPHARQRLFWMADTELCGSAARGPSRTHGRPAVEPHRCGATGELAIPPGEPGRLPEGCADRREDPEAGGRREAGGVGDASRAGFPPRERDELLGSGRRQEGRAAEQSGGSFWSDVEWLYCRDGRWRPTEPLVLSVFDGLSADLDGVRAALTLKAQEAVVSYGASTNRDTHQVLSHVRDSIRAEQIGKAATTGVREQLHAPEVLLTFLLHLSSAFDAGVDCRSIAKTRVQDADGRMRIMRPDDIDFIASCRWKPDEQRSSESTDALSALSLLLARCAEADEQAIRSAHASFVHPLAEGVTGRVALLRGAGNSIVPQVAAHFIEVILASHPQVPR